MNELRALIADIRVVVEMVSTDATPHTSQMYT